MSERFALFAKHVFEYEGYKTIIGGLVNTLVIAICGLIIGIIIGTVIACVQLAGKRNKAAKVFAVIGDIYTGIFRGTPIIVQLLIFHFVVFKNINVNINIAITPSYSIDSNLLEALLVFGLNSGAYVAEIMRGGIQSVDVGQLEAGRTLGLSYTTTMIKVVFPQAVKNVIPSLGNELIALTKDTSVAGYVATMDLNLAFRNIASATYDFMIPYLMLALVYLVIIVLMTFIVRLVERRLRKSEKK